MSVALESLGLILSLAIRTDVELSIAIGVGSRWGHPISFNVVLITSASFMLINKALISAFAAEDTTCFIIYATANSFLLWMFGLL